MPTVAFLTGWNGSKCLKYKNMDEAKFEKALEVKRELNWLVCDADGILEMPVTIDGLMTAQTVMGKLWKVYGDEISEFLCELSERFKNEREERIEQLRKEFDAL